MGMEVYDHHWDYSKLALLWSSEIMDTRERLMI